MPRTPGDIGGLSGFPQVVRPVRRRVEDAGLWSRGGAVGLVARAAWRPPDLRRQGPVAHLERPILMPHGTLPVSRLSGIVPTTTRVACAPSSSRGLRRIPIRTVQGPESGVAGIRTRRSRVEWAGLEIRLLRGLYCGEGSRFASRPAFVEMCPDQAVGHSVEAPARRAGRASGRLRWAAAQARRPDRPTRLPAHAPVRGEVTASGADRCRAGVRGRASIVDGSGARESRGSARQLWRGATGTPAR
jgi:hypothetical protein